MQAAAGGAVGTLVTAAGTWLAKTLFGDGDDDSEQRAKLEGELRNQRQQADMMKMKVEQMESQLNRASQAERALIEAHRQEQINVQEQREKLQQLERLHEQQLQQQQDRWLQAQEDVRKAQSQGRQELAAAQKRLSDVESQARQQDEHHKKEKDRMQAEMMQIEREGKERTEKLQWEQKKTEAEVVQLREQSQQTKREHEQLLQQYREAQQKYQELEEAFNKLHIELNKYKYEALDLAKRLEQIEGKDPSKSVEQLREEATRELNIDTINNINIGFCGAVKTGKSSLINALRAIKREHTDFAPVGQLETTSQIQGYPFPGQKRLVFWDIPGSDVPKFKRQSYFYDQRLYVFDFLVVLSRRALSETELLIAEKARQCGVPFAIIRSRCDEDLKNKRRDEGKTVDDTMKREFVQYVKKCYMAKIPLELKDHLKEIFCVSSVAIEQMNEGKQSKYLMDEAELMEYIHNQIRSQRAYQ